MTDIPQDMIERAMVAYITAGKGYTGHSNGVLEFAMTAAIREVLRPMEEAQTAPEEV